MANNKEIILAAGATAIVIGGIVIYCNRHTIFDAFKMLTTNNYFSDKELYNSATATAKKIDNKPKDDAIWANLNSLRTNVLNPVRQMCGFPITISSGYRSKALNQEVKGASNSQHLTGNAADLVPSNSKGTLAQIFAACASLGNYDQLIIEQDSKGNRWVHVSYNPANNRKQMMSYVSTRSPQYINITADQVKNYV